MEEDRNQNPQQAAPQEPVVHHRRRRRSKRQIFKETYLPMIIAGLTAVFLLVIIIGSISRAVSVHKTEKEIVQAESQAQEEKKQQEAQLAADLIQQADTLAASYNYQGAVDLIDSFTGNTADFPELRSKRAAYAKAQSELVAWDDPSKIPQLSFQLLIADPTRAFADEDYGSKYNRNYVTTDEFSKILQQLYDNGYMLVSLRDVSRPKPVKTAKSPMLPAPCIFPPTRSL